VTVTLLEWMGDSSGGGGGEWIRFGDGGRGGRMGSGGRFRTSSFFLTDAYTGSTGPGGVLGGGGGGGGRVGAGRFIRGVVGLATVVLWLEGNLCSICCCCFCCICCIFGCCCCCIICCVGCCCCEALCCGIFGGSDGLGGGFCRPLSSAKTDWEMSSFSLLLLWLAISWGFKGTTEQLFWLVWFEWRIWFEWMAAILDRLDEIKVSRSFLDGCLIDDGAPLGAFS